jgi:peptide methionine sulfoxide reductase MsrB
VDDFDARTACPRCRKRCDPQEFISPSGKPLKSCRACLDIAREDNRLRRARIGPAGVRAANLRDKYRISVEEYDALRANQGYRCAICQRHEDEIPASTAGRPRFDGRPTAAAFKLVVDHCHTTRRVRGLLCAGCNAAIGHFRDDEATLRAALTYLGFT